MIAHWGPARFAVSAIALTVLSAGLLAQGAQKIALVTVVSDNGSRLNVDLIDGPHRVEVRSEGYRPYTANVRVRRGQTETLNISLTK